MPTRPYPIVSVASTLDWPRILSPAEARAIRSAIETPHLRTLFDVLLYTGVKFAELRQLPDDPDRYDEARGTLAIFTNGEKKRTVVLGDRGVEAVEAFVGSGARMPVFPAGWRDDLIGAARRAGLPPHPAPPAAASPDNPCGIGVASTRKTWEAWLYATHPEWVRSITASQGRYRLKHVKRYGALSWSAEDLEAMRLETAGWEPLDFRLLGPRGSPRSAEVAGDGPSPSGPDAVVPRGRPQERGGGGARLRIDSLDNSPVRSDQYLYIPGATDRV